MTVLAITGQGTCLGERIGAVALALLLALASAPTRADGFAEGQAAYQAGRYADALERWLATAAEGDPRAQFAVGTLYFQGVGTAQDLEASARWFRLAAEQGFSPAQHNLGNAYKRGHGVPPDERLASHWWRRAAEQGFAPAQLNLGTQYYFGYGVPRDRNEALRWYRRAAENGHPDARRLLAGPARAAADAGSPAERSESWLLAQPADHYTLQIAATRDEDNALRLLEDLREGALFRFRRDRESWYAVVYGVYTERKAAEQAASSLPAELRAAGPWVRRLADVQAAIRARN